MEKPDSIFCPLFKASTKENIRLKGLFLISEESPERIETRDTSAKTALKQIGELNRCSTCAPKGHHSHGHQVDHVRLAGGELCQPHVKHADKDQRAESQDVTCRHRRTQKTPAHILRVRRQPAGKLTDWVGAGGERKNTKNNKRLAFLRTPSASLTPETSQTDNTPQKTSSQGCNRSYF